MERNRTSGYIKLLSVTSSIISIYIIIQLFAFSAEPAKNTNTTLPNKKYYSIHSLDIPDNLTFAGESVPVDKHWVKESIDRELLVNTYWQSQTVLFIKRCNRYFPIIEPILKEQGIPDDFKYLAVIESGLMPRSVSPAGAAGIWQFMKSTAIEYGLEVNTQVDERYHLEKATIAACKYFKKSYATYNNWTLVAASYNAGKNGINKQLKKQKATDYYNLLLGEETGRYVYRIIALKEILSSPDKYGFYVKDKDLYPTIDIQKINVNSSIDNIADFASNYGLSYKEFKDLNPWLRDNTLTNSRQKEYQISLPSQSKLNNNTIAGTNIEEINNSGSLNKELKLKNQNLSH
ncbi:lytic transglycosylase domain-containing protein [Labilibacter sediminis]|nr:lytic transglycosylase domain-containing protein [Labilibacter sediminis]